MISIESLNANDLPSYGPRARVSFITRREKSPACWRLIELVCRFARAVEDFGDLLGVAAIMKRAPLMERPVAVWLLGKPVPLISHSQVEDRLPPLTHLADSMKLEYFLDHFQEIPLEAMEWIVREVRAK